MKSFTPYGLLIGTVTILGIGIAEQWYLGKVADELVKEITTAEETFYLGNLEKSSEKLQSIISNWEKQEKKLEIMVNHEDVNNISEALIEIDSKLKNFLNSNNVSANFAVLKEYVSNIRESNEFTISNIL